MISPPPNILRELSVISRKLIVQKPFYGLFMMTLNKKISKDLDTAGVCKKGINFELLVNPIFWKTLTTDQHLGLFTHEMLHIVLNHVVDYKRFPNHQLFNIAADLYINSLLINETGVKCLPGADMSKEDHEAKMKPQWDAIDKKVKAGTITKEQAKEEMLSLPIRGCFAEDFKLNRTQAVSMGTNKIYRFLDDKLNKGDQNVKDAVQNQNDESKVTPWSHDDWKKITRDATDQDLDMMKKQVQYQLKTIVEQNDLKSKGQIPGYMKEMIDALFKKNPPATNWKAYVRRFFSSSTERYTKKTRRRQSKRMDDMPGIKVKTKQSVLVLIDTSASVTIDEIREGRNELFHIQKLGYSITCVEVDTHIDPKTGVYEFKGKFRNFITGRGGTEFTPGIEYANSVAKNHSCAIYITDGECYPSKVKSKLPLLWLLTTAGDSIKQFKKRGHTGPVVKITKKITQ